MLMPCLKMAVEEMKKIESGSGSGCAAVAPGGSACFSLRPWTALRSWALLEDGAENSWRKGLVQSITAYYCGMLIDSEHHEEYTNII